MATHQNRIQKTENRAQKTEKSDIRFLTSDFWHLSSCFVPVSNNSNKTTDNNFYLSLHFTHIHQGFFLTCHYLLSPKVQHRPLIDMDKPHLPSAKPEKLCALLNLDLPGRTICTKSAQDFVLRKAKIHKLHPPYLYQMSSSLVKGNLSCYSYFFQRHQTKSETGAKGKSKR